MQKHALDKIIPDETRFDPTLIGEGELLYYDKRAVLLPLRSDFPFLHFHNRYEVGIVISGEGQIISNGSFYTANEGDILFISPNVKHYSRSTDSKNPCYAKFVYLSPEATESILSERKLPKCGIPSLIRKAEHPDAVALLSGIFDTCASDLTLKAESVALRIAAFLAEAPKWFSEDSEQEHASDKSVGSGMKTVAEYLSFHFAASPTSAELAAVCHLSESQLRRNFQRAYGCSPIAYRNRLRLSAGRELLMHTTLSVGTISEQLGFSTASDFCRSFKKQFGISPSMLRKSNVKLDSD